MSKGSWRRGRLLVAVATSFVISAVLTAIVGATIGGSANSFVGDGSPNRFVGGPGNDTMSGGDADDMLSGGGGADSLGGDADDDTLIGDDAGDTASPDAARGGTGNDDIAGGAGSDLLQGGDGNDLIGTIDLTEVGGALIEETGEDQISAGAGADAALAGPGPDTIYGDSGPDSLFGEDGDDYVNPGPDDDYAYGGAGVDTLGYGPGVTVGLDIDLAVGLATGGSGTDRFVAFENVEGGAGTDTIDGDAGANVIEGAAGNDTLDGGPGGDTINSGFGDDRVISAETSGLGDTIRAFDGDDRIEARNGVVDTLDCGENANGSEDSDVLFADEDDVIAANCEIVVYGDPGPRTLSVTVAGDGTVSGTGISCPSDCGEQYDAGDSVELTATPGSGETFSGWTGACAGTGACSVSMTSDRTVGAEFTGDEGPPPDDTLAPQTSIDSGPSGKVRTRRRKARVTFRFSASETPATFECYLDGESLGACASPMTLKVKRGRHTFAVAATDAAGNTDPTPAQLKFRVVRKRG